jgi:hypothetical protein
MKHLATYSLLFVAVWSNSCTTLNIASYYHRHKQNLDSIEDTYRTAYQKKPFSIEFTDRSFNRVSLELITTPSPISTNMEWANPACRIP